MVKSNGWTKYQIGYGPVMVIESIVGFQEVTDYLLDMYIDAKNDSEKLGALSLLEFHHNNPYLAVAIKDGKREEYNPIIHGYI